jgi:YegS/Rv2252/BmrU family lipid kinase
MNKNIEYNRWLVIVNPNAGSRKGRRDWEEISKLLDSDGFNYEARFTEKSFHATELSRSGITEGFRRIIIVGGDGTMNEVVNGIFRQDSCHSSEVILGMITVGTGNDWGKMYNIPQDYKKAIAAIKAGKTRLQDAGRAVYTINGTTEQRYFANIAGLGFDASVVKRTNIQKTRGKSGKSSYYSALLKSLTSYKTTNTRVTVNEESTDNDTFSISIGIGKFSGGGMMQTPEALIDDGLFDITVIKSMNKLEIIRSLKKLYDGSILEHPKIISLKGDKIRIESEPEISLEADGESLGYSPIEFNIIPKSLTAIYAGI